MEERSNETYQLVGGIEAAIASYSPDEYIEEYKNNPFIEALPPILSQEDVIERLSVYPSYDEKEREYDTKRRIHLTQRLYQYFQPLSLHFDLEDRFSRTIRQGYLSRNPLSKDYASSLKNGSKVVKNPSLGFNNTDFRSTASGFTIMGVSGIGKTTSIDRVLSLYPQVILHSDYNGVDLNLLQISWLKLDCPYDGSVKALCINFFAKVDSLLGTQYSMKFTSGQNTTATMLPRMAQVCTLHGIGVLVLDEIQHLSTRGGSEQLLNFFTTLVNVIGIPVIMIGTMKALGALQGQFRQARRGSGQGDMVLDRMEKDDNWDILIEGMWEYQWTKTPTELTEELKDVLYEESQGITDIAIKLYIMAQIQAMTSTKKEIITPAMIKQVAKSNLKLVKPMLDALKSGNLEKLAKYEDITPVDIDSFVTNRISDLEMKERVSLLKKKKSEVADKNQKNKVKEDILTRLAILGIDDKNIGSFIDKILKENTSIDVNEIVKRIYTEAILNKKEATVKPKPAIKVSNSKTTHVLKDIVTVNKGIKTIHQALLDEGYIKNPIVDLAI